MESIHREEVVRNGFQLNQLLFTLLFSYLHFHLKVQVGAF